MKVEQLLAPTVIQSIPCPPLLYLLTLSWQTLAVPIYYNALGHNILMQILLEVCMDFPVAWRGSAVAVGLGLAAQQRCGIYFP